MPSWRAIPLLSASWGMGRRPDLKRASKRTAVGEIRLAPGHRLVTQHSFIDVSESADEASVREAIHRMVEDGAQVIVVSEAFGVDDAVVSGWR